MIVCRVEMRHFRGVEHAEVDLDAPLLALIGSGDAAKTTLLEAIAWTLWPSWHLGVTDADFTGCDVSAPIEIRVTIRPVPAVLLDERQFGLWVRGWDPSEHNLYDEPQDGHERALTIRLSVDRSLEPVWDVVAKRHGDEGRRINAAQRRLLGVNRLGEDVDRHLAWGRSSALLGLTEDTAGTESLLADLHRDVRRAVSEADLGELDDAAEAVRAASAQLGAGAVAQDLYPALDPSEIAGRAASISLHAGPGVPLRQFGVGTRRIVALGVQAAASAQDGAVMLIDEIETGLEPFRIRHLLRSLRAALGFEEVALPTPARAGQVLATTHSPVVVTELASDHLRIVRLLDGELSVMPVPPELQGLTRRHPDVLLGRAALVSEGKTEEGLLRSMADHWARERNGDAIANRGIVIVNGSGRTRAPQAALELQQLGYEVCVVGDSDAPLEPSPEYLRDRGMSAEVWSGGVATEERIAEDLPMDALRELWEAISDDRGIGVVAGEVLSRADGNRDDYGDTFDDWLQWGLPEDELRAAFGEAMKECSWIKRVDWGELVGRLISEYWAGLPDGCDLAHLLSRVEDWCYSR